MSIKMKKIKLEYITFLCGILILLLNKMIVSCILKFYFWIADPSASKLQTSRLPFDVLDITMKMGFGLILISFLILVYKWGALKKKIKE